MTDERPAGKGTRTLVAGLLAPLIAAGLGMVTYRTLTRASVDRDADFMFRLSLTAFAMTVPFWLTLFSSLIDRRNSTFGPRSKVGLAVAVLSLGMAIVPIRGAISRTQQADNLALADVAAPEIDTTDLDGKSHRLSDYAGQVVLINIWATWCPPCKEEMPELDELYAERRDQGFMVLGLSVEDIETQRNFVENVLSVTYPLLTTEGEVAALYSTTARYPANYLVDRQGRLQPAPSVERPFEELVEAVDALLAAPAPASD